MPATCCSAGVGFAADLNLDEVLAPAVFGTSCGWRNRGVGDELFGRRLFQRRLWHGGDRRRRRKKSLPETGATPAAARSVAVVGEEGVLAKSGKSYADRGKEC